MMLRYLSEVVEEVEMPTMPLCACRCAAQSDQASVSSAHAKAVGAGSDQAATRRHAGIRKLTLATCARRETHRNQSAKLG